MVFLGRIVGIGPPMLRIESAFINYRRPYYLSYYSSPCTTSHIIVGHPLHAGSCRRTTSHRIGRATAPCIPPVHSHACRPPTILFPYYSMGPLPPILKGPRQQIIPPHYIGNRLLPTELFYGYSSSARWMMAPTP